jgi:hypothetical protein
MFQYFAACSGFTSFQEWLKTKPKPRSTRKAEILKGAGARRSVFTEESLASILN